MAERMTSGHRTGLRVTLIASASTTMAVLPVWLTGGLSVFMTRDLVFDEQQLGFAVAGFFLASALASIPGGQLAERVGARRGIPLATSVSALTMAGIAWFATSWLGLLLLLVCAGAANGLIHPAVNLALARQVTSRRALAFGIKQSAIPSATLLAGMAVPLIGLSFGWRGAFGGAAVATVAVAVAGVATLETSQRGRERKKVEVATRRPFLIGLTIAAGLGAGAGNAMAAFLVPSAVSSGLSAPEAGVVLLTGSLSCIATRIYAGWRADGRSGGHLRMVGMMLAAGALGYVLLAWTASPPLVIGLGAVLAFAAGWGWAGLFNFAIVERNPDGPAAATGIIQVGIFTGAVAGPSVFGTIVVSASYPAAWATMAVTAVGAAAIILGVRRSIMRDLVASSA